MQAVLFVSPERSQICDSTSPQKDSPEPKSGYALLEKATKPRFNSRKAIIQASLSSYRFSSHSRLCDLESPFRVPGRTKSQSALNFHLKANTQDGLRESLHVLRWKGSFNSRAADEKTSSFREAEDFRSYEFLSIEQGVLNREWLNAKVAGFAFGQVAGFAFGHGIELFFKAALLLAG
jgi:hypothetical protein